MSDPDHIRLQHMLDAAAMAEGFIAGRDRVDMDQDAMLLHACVNCLLIVGEAASQISIPTRERLSQIPWPQIVGMRNRLVHAYFQIDRDIVWDTLTVNLPPLTVALQNELREDDSEE